MSKSTPPLPSLIIDGTVLAVPGKEETWGCYRPDGVAIVVWLSCRLGELTRAANSLSADARWMQRLARIFSAHFSASSLSLLLGWHLNRQARHKTGKA